MRPFFITKPYKITLETEINYVEESQRLVDLMNAQGGQVNAFWSVYAVVLFGLAGFIFSNANVRQSPHFKYLILLFGLFAFANGAVIYKAQGIIFFANEELQRLLQVKTFVETHPYWTATIAKFSPTPA